ARTPPAGSREFRRHRRWWRAGPSMPGGRESFLPENVVADVRPELLEEVEQAVESNLVSPLLSGLGPGALALRVVEVGDARAGAVAHDLGEVEGLASGIGAGDEQTADGVARPREESAVEAGVVARVFTGQRGHDGLGEVVAHGLVGEGVPVIAPESGAALVEFRVG